MKTKFLLAFLIGLSSCIFAQSGAIHGNVYDEYGEPAYTANIRLVDAPTTTGTSCDFDGDFKVKPLNPGLYTIEVTFMGYHPTTITGIEVYNNKITFLEDVHLASDVIMLTEAQVIAYVNLIDPEDPSIDRLKGSEIMKIPCSKNPAAIAAKLKTDVSIVGNQMVVRGSRPGSSSVYIDGMKVSDEMASLPSLSIGSMEIYTGGIPAKYGDVTGGVIMMNTKSYFDILAQRKAAESRR